MNTILLLFLLASFSPFDRYEDYETTILEMTFIVCCMEPMTVFDDDFIEPNEQLEYDDDIDE